MQCRAPSPTKPLTGAPVPLDRQPQRLTLGVELEGNPIVAQETHVQPHPASALEADVQLDRAVAALENLGPQRALRGGELLASDHALRELHEVVVDRSLGDPQATGAQQSPTSPPQGERERAQRDLEPQRPSLQYDHWRIFLQKRPSPCPRSREGHKT